MGFEATIEPDVDGGVRIMFMTDNERTAFIRRAQFAGAFPSFGHALLMSWLISTGFENYI